MNFGRVSSIDRVALIRQVGKGDADAAYRLGDYYSTSGVPEAAVFWFRKAVALGNKNIKMETIELIETNIIQGEL
jgi:TPR repeat protein